MAWSGFLLPPPLDGGGGGAEEEEEEGEGDGAGLGRFCDSKVVPTTTTAFSNVSFKKLNMLMCQGREKEKKEKERKMGRRKRERKIPVQKSGTLQK